MSKAENADLFHSNPFILTCEATMSDYVYSHHRRPEMVSLMPSLDQPLRILEVGCGTGTFRDYVAEGGEYWGIDPARQVSDEANQRLDRVMIGTFDEVFPLLPDEYFDCVVCNDVIEHMSDENAFLQNIKQKLAPGGCIVGSIPNVRYVTNLWELLAARDWQYRDAGILDRTHQRFFTQKSLLRTLKKNHYRIEHFGGINNLFAEKRGPKAWLRTLPTMLLSLILGNDTRYLQFAFRIRPGA